MKLLLDSFPDAHSHSVYPVEGILSILRKYKRPTYLCFRRVTLMDRMAFNKDGGIFAGFFSIDWMRALSYKHAAVPSMTVTIQTLKMGILERTADRKWVNLPMYLQAIKTCFGDVCLP